MKNKKISLSNIDFKCISLTSRKDRREWTKKHLSDYNINFEFVDASNGDNTISQLPFPEIYKKGQKGCLISHYELIKNYNPKNEKILGIFEDDILLCEDFVERMSYIEKNFKYDWDIFYLSSFYHLESDKGSFHKNGDFELTGTKYIHRTYGSFCTHSYLVNPKSINKIIKLIDSNIVNSNSYDHLLILIQPFLNAYTFSPGMTNQVVSFSDVDESNKKNQNEFIEIIGEHIFVNKLEEFDYDDFFINKNYKTKIEQKNLKYVELETKLLEKKNIGISNNIKKYNFKFKDQEFTINNYDYFTTDYFLKESKTHTLSEEYISMIELLSTVGKNKSVIDVGGNCGMFSIPASMIGYNVYSFEPIEMNVKLLTLNKLENNCTSLNIIHSALYNENVEKTIYIPYCSDNTSFNQEVAISNMKRKNFIEESVECITFDGWIKDKKIDVGFIKIDVQGSEYEVLEGMSNFLNKNNDIYVFIEWDKLHTEKCGHSLEELNHKFKNLGFTEIKNNWTHDNKLFYKK